MKILDTFAWYKHDNKIILMIGPNYSGNPMIKCKYDTLIIDEELFKEYKDYVIPKHYKGWTPRILFV